jgi:hypothetical protein
MLAAGRCGLAETDPAELGEVVVACWDAFLDVASDPATDLTRPSRLPGWSGADTCIHLGAWEGSTPLQGIRASARAGGAGEAGSPDVTNARLVAAHRGEGTDAVLSALVQARDALADWFDGPEPAELGRQVSSSAVGPLPVLSLVHAGVYELAVHALDLAPCGAPAPSALLLERGLGALLDVTGALSARLGVRTTVSAQTPAYGWAFRSDDDGWTTTRTSVQPPGPGVRGSAQDLLDTSAGRTNLAQLLLTRRLVVHDLTGFMGLAPLLHEVPGLPGGPVLRTAVGGLGRVTRLLRLS